MGRSAKNDMKYALLLKDDISLLTWLFVSSAPDAETATDAIGLWVSIFRSMDWIVSGQGSHFTATVMHLIADDYCIPQHFTTAYCPWANCTIERLCKEVLRTAKSLLSEWKLPPTHWPSVSNCIQLVINNSPLELLGRGQNSATWRTPLRVFTETQPRPVMIRLVPLTHLSEHEAMYSAIAREVAKLASLHTALNEMHQAVAAGNKKRRTRAQKTHNVLTRVVPVNFTIGDYVMIRSTRGRQHKRTSRWISPMRIIATRSHLVYEVENLGN